MIKKSNKKYIFLGVAISLLIIGMTFASAYEQQQQISQPSLLWRIYDFMKKVITGKVTLETCGNGTCEAGEDYTSCPEDCGVEYVTTPNDDGTTTYEKYFGEYYAKEIVDENGIVLSYETNIEQQTTTASSISSISSVSSYGISSGNVELTLIWTPGSFASEPGFEIIDLNTGQEVFCEASGGIAPSTSPQTFYVSEGVTYEVRGYDSWGDGWNGGILQIYQENDLVFSSTGPPNAGSIASNNLCGNGADPLGAGAGILGTFIVEAPICIPQPEICTDGIDNDCDGLIDCDDTDCSLSPNCALPFCGDGICNLDETSESCPADCIIGSCSCISCADCIAKLSNPACTNILLSESLTSSGTCINNPLDSNNKIFDCRGNSIAGTGTGSGIYFSGKNYITVQNCVINGFSFGINFAHSNSPTVSYNTLASNVNYGLLIASSNNALLNYNTINNNPRGGIAVDTQGYLQPCSYNAVIENNEIFNQGGIANWGMGIYLGSADGATVANNLIYNNQMGILSRGQYCSANHIITNNQVYNNVKNGIDILQHTGQTNGPFPTGITLAGNNVYSNGYHGINFQSAKSNSVISNNQVTGNMQNGLNLISNSNDNLLDGNFIGYNYGLDIFISGSTGNIGDNICNTLNVGSNNVICSTNPPAVCGNGFCEQGEDTINCPLDCYYTEVSHISESPSYPFGHPSYTPNGNFKIIVSDSSCVGTYTVSTTPVLGSAPDGSNPPNTMINSYIGLGQGMFTFNNAGVGQYTVTVTETGLCNPLIDPVIITVTVPNKYLAPSCGDAIIQPELGEQCDDGNTFNGDCCSSTCAFEPIGTVCGTSSNDYCNGLGECGKLSCDSDMDCFPGSYCYIGQGSVGTYKPVASCTQPYVQVTGQPGTQFIGSGDDSTYNLNIPFNFQLYGNDYSTIKASTNGFMVFPSTGATRSFSNANLPTTSSGAAIYPFWDDLHANPSRNPSTGIYTRVDGIAPNRIYTIEWYQIGHFSHTIGQEATFQVKLFETTNKIQLKYLDVIFGGTHSGFDKALSATIGIEGENIAPRKYDLYGFNIASLSDGQCIEYAPNLAEEKYCRLPSCGNALCEIGETYLNCPLDCPCIPQPEICTDGVDNDCDGLIDCEDSDCASAPNCAPIICPENQVITLGSGECSTIVNWDSATGICPTYLFMGPTSGSELSIGSYDIGYALGCPAPQPNTCTFNIQVNENPQPHDVPVCRPGVLNFETSEEQGCFIELRQNMLLDTSYNYGCHYEIQLYDEYGNQVGGNGILPHLLGRTLTARVVDYYTGEYCETTVKGNALGTPTIYGGDFDMDCAQFAMGEDFYPPAHGVCGSPIEYTYTEIEMLTPNPLCHRIFERTYTVTDLMGNSASAIVNLHVRDMVAPFIIAPANMQVDCEGDLPEWTEQSANAIDLCNEFTVSLNKIENNLNSCQGNVMYQWSATDVCDNTATASTVVFYGTVPMIQDNQVCKRNNIFSIYQIPDASVPNVFNPCENGYLIDSSDLKQFSPDVYGYNHFLNSDCAPSMPCIEEYQLACYGQECSSDLQCGNPLFGFGTCLTQDVCVKCSPWQTNCQDSSDCNGGICSPWGQCTSCGETPECVGDASRTAVFDCGYLSPTECENSYVYDYNWGAQNCYLNQWGGCERCDPYRQSDGQCTNTCGEFVPPVACADSSLLYTHDCWQSGSGYFTFDASFGPMSCAQAPWNPQEYFPCYPWEQANGNCVNTCGEFVPPVTCLDSSRQYTSEGCWQHSGNREACEGSFEYWVGQGAIACQYGDPWNSEACFACESWAESQGWCSNTCGEDCASLDSSACSASSSCVLKQQGTCNCQSDLICPPFAYFSSNEGECGTNLVDLWPAESPFEITCSYVDENNNVVPYVSGGYYNVGSYSVTCESGIKSCGFGFDIRDYETPEITCPSNMNLLIIEGETIAANWNLPEATDNCGISEIVQVSGPASGSMLSAGTYDVSYEAYDNSGNVDTCYFNIDVKKANIVAVVTSNTVEKGKNSVGQQPVVGAEARAYNRNDACVNTYFPKNDLIVANCEYTESCITDLLGTCYMAVPEGYYTVIANANAFTGNNPGHAIGFVDSTEIKKARIAYLIKPDGKTDAGNTKNKKGSELWIYEPIAVNYQDNIYYAWVFESEGDWEVDVCVSVPEGYTLVDGSECLQSFVAGELKSLLFEYAPVQDGITGNVIGNTPEGNFVSADLRIIHGGRVIREENVAELVKVDDSQEQRLLITLVIIVLAIGIVGVVIGMLLRKKPSKRAKKRR